MMTMLALFVELVRSLCSLGQGKHAYTNKTAINIAANSYKLYYTISVVLKVVDIDPRGQLDHPSG